MRRTRKVIRFFLRTIEDEVAHSNAFVVDVQLARAVRIVEIDFSTSYWLLLQKENCDGRSQAGGSQARSQRRGLVPQTG
jgi:hypothetical protein